MSTKRGSNADFQKAVDAEESFTAEQMRRAAEFRITSNLDVPAKQKKAKKASLKTSKKAIERKLDEV